MACGITSADCRGFKAVGEIPYPMKEQLIPTLLLVGLGFIVSGCALISGKLALIASGLVFVFTAWALIRAGR